MRVEKSNRVCGQGLRAWPRQDDSMVRLFRNSETRLKVPLGLRGGQHIKKRILSDCLYDHSKKSLYQIDRWGKEVVHCSNLLF